MAAFPLVGIGMKKSKKYPSCREHIQYLAKYKYAKNHFVDHVSLVCGPDLQLCCSLYRSGGQDCLLGRLAILGIN
jgi:hypothetical protein